MSDKKTIWICPVTTLTFRDIEAFKAHLARKINALETALRQPARFSKVINHGAEDE